MSATINPCSPEPQPRRKEKPMQLALPFDHETHVVAISGGKDSTAMALRLAEVEPREYLYVCTPTGDEPDEMFAHWRNLGELLGKPIIPAVAHTGFNGLIEQQNALPNWRQRWCTRILKIQPFAAFLREHAPAVCYVGLRADEELREGVNYRDMAGATQRYPMREWGWELCDVLGYLEQRGIAVPVRTDCEQCFFQTLWEWYVLWRDNPKKYARGEAHEERTGHTFRSPGRDTQPAALKDLREKFEAGYIPKERRRDAMKMGQCRTCTM